jgi:hypothetical protein
MNSNTKRHWFAQSMRELVMVTLGVLIALAANAWWQKRAERTLEADYVARLKAELRTDLGTLDTLDQHTARIKVALDSVLPFFEEGQLPGGPARVIVNSYAATRRWKAGFLTTSYDELVNTGTFRLIRSASTRSALTAAYASMHRYPDGWFGEAYRDAARRAIPATVQIAIRQNCKSVQGCSLAVDPALASKTVARMRQDEDLLGAFRLEVHDLILFERDTRDTRAAVLQALRQIESGR